MELVYLWVEEYKNIHNQGFNFSPGFDCKFHDEYDEDGKLKDNCKLEIKENDDYIENFFGDNINVTAIVGKNGSGKSSIIESLQAINIINPIYGESGFSSKYILIVNVNTENTSLPVIKNIKIDTNIIDIRYDKSICEESDENIDFLFESIFFDAELPYNEFNKYSVARENFLTNAEFKHTKEYTYMDFDSDSICKKLLQIDKESLLNSINFIPEYLTISENNKVLEEKRNLIIYDYHTLPRFEQAIIQKIDNIIKNIIDKEESFIFGLFLSSIDTLEEKKILELLDKIKINENIVKILKPYVEDIYTDMKFSEYENLLAENIRIIDSDKVLLVKYFEYLDIEMLDKKNRSFNNLSHGEKMFLGMAVNISYFLQESKRDNFLLCFDEPDLSLHPMWQKNYMMEIINLCKQFDKKIHLVFTIHSPFILSDIPKQNIIFLDTDKEGNCKVVDGLKEKKQTFGANIHTLLSDSFFMEDGLMGEFAKGKIEEVIHYLNNQESPIENNDEAQKLIDIIGEPIIRNQLQKMLDSKRLSKIDEIDSIKQEILNLQNRMKEIEDADDKS